MWVAVGQGTNSIAYSYDGSTNWTGIPKTNTNTFTNYGVGVAWNGTMWVALGYGTNSIIYSVNGTTNTWFPVPNNTNIFSGYGQGVASGYTPKPLGVSSSIIPSKTNTYNLGSTANIWNNAFISHINGTPMSSLTLKEGFFGTIVLVRNNSAYTTGSKFVIKDNNNPANTIAIGFLNSDSSENVIISENSNLRLLRPHNEYNIEYFYSNFYNRSISNSNIELVIQKGTSRRATNSNKFYFYPDFNNIYGGVLTLTSRIAAFTNTGFYGRVIVENINGGNGGRYLDYKWNRNLNAITPDYIHPLYTSDGIPITSFTRIPANGAASSITILEIDKLTDANTFIGLAINIQPYYRITNFSITGATLQVGSPYPDPNPARIVGAVVMLLKVNANNLNNGDIKISYTIEHQLARTGFYGTITINNFNGGYGGRYIDYFWNFNRETDDTYKRRVQSPVRGNSGTSTITISEADRLQDAYVELILGLNYEGDSNIQGFSHTGAWLVKAKFFQVEYASPAHVPNPTQYSQTVYVHFTFYQPFGNLSPLDNNGNAIILNNGAIVLNFTMAYLTPLTGFYGTLTVNNYGGVNGKYLDYYWVTNSNNNDMSLNNTTRILANGPASSITISQAERLQDYQTDIKLYVTLEPGYTITAFDSCGVLLQIPAYITSTIQYISTIPYISFLASPNNLNNGTIYIVYAQQNVSTTRVGFYGTLIVNNIPGANGGRYLEYQWFVNGSPLNSLTRINTNGAPSSITISEGSRLDNMNTQLTLNVTLEANAEITGFSFNNENNPVTLVSSSQFQKIFTANSNNLNDGIIVANYTVNNTYVPPPPSNTGFNGSITINHNGEAYSYYVRVLADNSVRYDAQEYSSSVTFSIGTQLASPASYLYIIAEPAGMYDKADGGFTNPAITYHGYETVDYYGYEKYSIPSSLNNDTIVYEFGSYFND
jgi:hypothetical protein